MIGRAGKSIDHCPLGRFRLCKNSGGGGGAKRGGGGAAEDVQQPGEVFREAEKIQQKTLVMGGEVIKKGLTALQIDNVMNASGASGGTPEYKAHMSKVASAFKAAGIKAEDYPAESRGRGKIERLYRRYG